MEVAERPARAETTAMYSSPIIRRYTLLPAPRGWKICRYDEASAAAMSATKASTSSGVVSHEHIQRTSPLASSQT